MKLMLKGGGGLLLVFLIAAGYWYYRPGSEFSPREVIEMSSLEDRRRSYRMMETVYPSSPIAAPRLRTAFARDLVDLDLRYEWLGQPRTFDDYIDQRKVQGILVLKDGVVRYERFFGEAEPDDRFTSWSVAKSVVATLIGIALGEGRIGSLDDRVSQYASEYEETDYGDTSIRHLLMMSSGIDFNENYEEPGADIRKLFFNTFLLNRDVDRVVRQFTRNRPAGEDFDYISSNTQVLSAVLRGAYDRPLIETMNEKLSIPLGLTGGSWLTDRQGAAKKELGYCCLQLTLEDYAKLGQLYVQDGVVGETRIIPEGWRSFVSTPPRASHKPKGEGRLGYGHHFWLIGGQPGSFTMQGYDGQYVHIDPAERVVIVIASADRTMDFTKPREFPPLFKRIKEELRSTEASLASGN
ncbi:MAG: serine hydrolase [Pseudomonadota bacterium]